jgi:hypothetical protein
LSIDAVSSEWYLSDLIRVLLEKLLGRAQDNLYRSPPRDWHHIDQFDRMGRIALMLIVAALILIPLGWIVFG